MDGAKRAGKVGVDGPGILCNNCGRKPRCAMPDRPSPYHAGVHKMRCARPAVEPWRCTRTTDGGQRCCSALLPTISAATTTTTAPGFSASTQRITVGPFAAPPRSQQGTLHSQPYRQLRTAARVGFVVAGAAGPRRAERAARRRRLSPGCVGEARADRKSTAEGAMDPAGGVAVASVVGVAVNSGAAGNRRRGSRVIWPLSCGDETGQRAAGRSERGGTLEGVGGKSENKGKRAETGPSELSWFKGSAVPLAGPELISRPHLSIVEVQDDTIHTSVGLVAGARDKARGLEVEVAALSAPGPSTCTSTYARRRGLGPSTCTSTYARRRGLGRAAFRFSPAPCDAPKLYCT